MKNRFNLFNNVFNFLAILRLNSQSGKFFKLNYVSNSSTLKSKNQAKRINKGEEEEWI